MLAALDSHCYFQPLDLDFYDIMHLTAEQYHDLTDLLAHKDDFYLFFEQEIRIWPKV